MTITILSFFSSFTLLVAMLGSRLHDILGHGELKTGLERLLILQGTIWIAYLIRIGKWRYVAWLAALCAATLLHSWSFLYQPSLRSGVPVYDYMISKTVSAGHCWMFAKLYVKRFALIALGAYVWADIFKRGRRIDRSLPLITLGVVFLIQFLVAHAQSEGFMVNSWFGSGSSWASHRVPALFEDSGAFSVNMGVMFAGILGFVWELKRPFFTKTILVLLVFVMLLSLKPLAGSLLMVLPLAGLLSTTLLRSILSRYPFLGNMSTLLPLCFSAYLFFCYYGFVARTGSGERVFLDEVLYKIDPVRGVNWKTMMIAIGVHPLTGSGLGAFFAEFDQYARVALTMGGGIFYDPPTNAYLLIMSELGLGGIAIVYMILAAAKSRTISAPVLASYLAVLVSFLVGIHWLFISFTMLLSVVVGGCITARITLNLKKLCSIVICYLLLVSGWRYLTAPFPGDFRSLERGSKQALIRR